MRVRPRCAYKLDSLSDDVFPRAEQLGCPSGGGFTRLAHMPTE